MTVTQLHSLPALTFINGPAQSQTDPFPDAMKEPTALTVKFEVTLSGASRYADAAEVLQALRPGR